MDRAFERLGAVLYIGAKVFLFASFCNDLLYRLEHSIIILLMKEHDIRNACSQDVLVMNEEISTRQKRYLANFCFT